MWVKICANTNLEDAKFAAELGADAVGFVFAPSKRQVSIEQVAPIVSHLPAGIEKIGVFTSYEADEIVEIVRATGLTGVQLHGGFDVHLARRLKQKLGDVSTIIQTLHWQVDGEASAADAVAAQLRVLVREAAIDRVLVDSKRGTHAGGTGIRFDWNSARDVLYDLESKLILAGGLQPENVDEAIEILHPWGVDVASGVESFPGRKDKRKLEMFLRNARSSLRAADLA